MTLKIRNFSKIIPPPPPAQKKKKQKKKKKKKKNGDIIPLRLCTMSEDHRSYGVWFLRYKAQRTVFVVILGHFFTLTLLVTQK